MLLHVLLFGWNAVVGKQNDILYLNQKHILELHNGKEL